MKKAKYVNRRTNNGIKSQAQKLTKTGKKNTLFLIQLKKPFFQYSPLVFSLYLKTRDWSMGKGYNDREHEMGI